MEKAIKSVLFRHNIRFPLVHDLEALIEIARHARLPLQTWADDVAMLNPYAVETRYPGHWEDLEEAEVNKALKIAKEAVEWAKSMLGAA